MNGLLTQTAKTHNVIAQTTAFTVA